MAFDCGMHPLRISTRAVPASVRAKSGLVRRHHPSLADVDLPALLAAVDAGDVAGITPGKIHDAHPRIEVACGQPPDLCWAMDVFGPSVAPGVTTPSRGGLSAREAIELMRSLAGLNMVAMDFNTVSPAHDVHGMAAHLRGHMMMKALVLLVKAV